MVRPARAALRSVRYRGGADRGRTDAPAGPDGGRRHLPTEENVMGKRRNPRAAGRDWGALVAPRPTLGMTAAVRPEERGRQQRAGRPDRDPERERAGCPVGSQCESCGTTDG